jgi:hypothetical protein
METAESSESFLATDDYTATHLKGRNINTVIFYVYSIHALPSRNILLVCKTLSGGALCFTINPALKIKHGTTNSRKTLPFT